MCEKCLQQAEINALNAAAIKELAEAAAGLSTQVPGSEQAVKNIVARIELMAQVPAPEGNPEGNQEDLPEELKQLQELFEKLGIKGEFIDIRRV